MPTAFDVIILGAGAAGLMCALTAGGRGRRVLLLDHAEAAGKKILISGGGRCNFTNLATKADRFLSDNPHFCRAALAGYSPPDFVALVDKHNIAWHEKTLGQLFCDGSARQIVAMLLEECAAVGVDIRLSHRITAVDHGFRVETDHGAFSAPSLVLATGGPAIPKMGASGFAYDVAARFGLKLVPPRPALVPLTFAGDDLALMLSLSGVALDVIARTGKASFAEAMLFTHRGLSGPAILQISSYWKAGQDITLDLLPGMEAATVLMARKLERPNAALRTVLGEVLPHRLAQAWAAPFENQTMAGLRDRSLGEIAGGLKTWRLAPVGTEGYAKAEVTAGGVATDGLSQRTLEAKTVPGLYVIGEAVDVTGWLGGYNFQWAWASGFAAGRAG